MVDSITTVTAGRCSTDTRPETWYTCLSMPRSEPQKRPRIETTLFSCAPAPNLSKMAGKE